MERDRRDLLRGVMSLTSILVLVCASCGRLDQKNAPQALSKSAVLEVYQVSSSNTANSRAEVDPQTGSPIYLTLPAAITSADIATVQRDDSHETPSLTFNLAPQGAQKLSAITTPAQGQQLAFVVNGKLTSVAKVRSPLSNSFNISGGAMQNGREEIFAALTK